MLKISPKKLVRLAAVEPGTWRCNAELNSAASWVKWIGRFISTNMLNLTGGPRIFLISICYYEKASLSGLGGLR